MKRDKRSSLPREIIRYYELGREADRLSSAEGELELFRTQEIIRRYLPGSPSVILDIGGGPGTHACWLAKEGYEVHLVDPVPLHLEQAKRASDRQPETPIASLGHGDGRHLAFPAECADVVLLLGPLYHLAERRDRMSVMREACRVLKNGGTVIAVGISRFASTLSGLIDGFFQDPGFIEVAKRDLVDGQHRNPTGKASYFTTSFFHHPLELESEVKEAGFSVERTLAVEGAAVFLQDLEEHWKDSTRREIILDTVRWLEDEPSVLGVTGHLMVIGRKPA
jgi:ubiquinone/menaquinone biosynthesis C-methylase UbiE